MNRVTFRYRWRGIKRRVTAWSDGSIQIDVGDYKSEIDLSLDEIYYILNKLQDEGIVASWERKHSHELSPVEVDQ